ncbi:MAG TPA: hypothetical protein VGB71_16985 [Flavisolibacter sp.]
MKKIIFILLTTIGLQQFAIAQTSASIKEPTAFENAMLKNISQLDTASNATTLIALANNFERIGNAEKTTWQPFYYAAYCYVAMAFQSHDKSAIDPLADKAEAFIQQAEAVEKNNSEITTLSAMINACRITVDPVSRFQTKGKEVHASLAKAKEENAANPRIYLLQAQMQLRTPEAFGGGKVVAKKSAEIALEKFKVFQPSTSIHPKWGEEQAKSLLQKISQ